MSVRLAYGDAGLDIDVDPGLGDVARIDEYA